MLPELSEISQGRYRLPSMSIKVNTFKGAEFNEHELAEQLNRSTSFSRLFEKNKLDSVEGFSEIISIITIAKELHDIGRDDIVVEQFFDVLCWDSYYENILGAISSVFSGFYSDYDDSSEEEFMIFEDDVISSYFEMARVYGKKTSTPHEQNPYIIQANNEVSRQLNYCYSMDWKLLGYTKTRKTAKQSKLIVYIGNCGCDCHGHLAYGLIQLYKWFSDKVAEFKEQSEVMAA